MKKVHNDINIDDKMLFEEVSKQYQSENERRFFEHAAYCQENVFTFSNELLLSELDNEDHIYLVRVYFEEYILGHGTEGQYDEETHTMNLSDALSTNLMEKGYLDKDMTFLEWLRARDYAGVLYDHNFDNL